MLRNVDVLIVSTKFTLLRERGLYLFMSRPAKMVGGSHLIVLHTE